MRALFIGIGNRFRHDDGVGPALADRLRAEAIEHLDITEACDDLIRLVDLWVGYDLVVLADAVFAGQEPGTLYRRDVLASPLPRHWFALSSHQLGVAEAVEIGRSMQRLPPRLLFVGIEGRDFSHGEGLSPEVARCVPAAVEVIESELTSRSTRPIPPSSSRPSSC